MRRVYVLWGKDPKVKKLSAKKQKELAARINEKAKDRNAFIMTLTGVEHRWLKKHLANAEMEFIMHVGTSCGRLVAIGTDKAAIADVKREELGR